jgi:Na+-driven multidrug efflux pump
MNGAGDTKTPTWINMWLLVFSNTFGYILAIVLKMGPLGAFIAIPVAETFLALAAWYYFKKGKWKEVKV